MAKVNFTYNALKTVIQCLKDEKMSYICNKYASKIETNINSLYFLYNGNKVNLELTFNEQANSLDNERNEMNILAFKEDLNDIKCPKCGESINIDNCKIYNDLIKFNKSIRNMLNELKSQIEYINIKEIDEIDILENKLVIIKSFIDKIIDKNDKYKTGCR